MVSKEISDYFTKLDEPFVTTQRLEKMFGKRKDKIIENLKKNLPHRIRKSYIFGGENCSSREKDGKSKCKM